MNLTYLDHAATTPVDPRVQEAMSPHFGENFGNPSSVHTFGQRAETALEEARRTMADLLGCQPEEILFTSCGTESDNLALRGAAFAARESRQATHILISPVEHHAVSHTARQLQEVFGFEVEEVPVDEYGRVDPQQVGNQLRPETAVVSIMHANNEIGTLNPISDIGSLVREHGIPFHTDAVQSGAHFPLTADSLNVDLLSLGAHKFYGPKGIGALYVRKNTPLLPTQTGGSQEFGKRAATENVPYIVGMATAFRLVHQEAEQRSAHVTGLRDDILSSVMQDIPDVRLTGHPQQRLPNHASFAFKDVDGNMLVSMLDVEGFACSSGSACKTGNPEPSSVLLSLGFDRQWASGSLRVTVGKDTRQEDVQSFIEILPDIIHKIRELKDV